MPRGVLIVPIVSSSDASNTPLRSKRVRFKRENYPAEGAIRDRISISDALEHLTRKPLPATSAQHAA